MFTLPNLFSTPNVEAAQRDTRPGLPAQYNGFGGGFLPDLANRMTQGAAQGHQMINDLATKIQANPSTAPEILRQSMIDNTHQIVGGMSQALLSQSGPKPSQQYYTQLMQAQNATPQYTQPGVPTPAFSPQDARQAQASIPSAFPAGNAPGPSAKSDDLNVPYRSAVQQAVTNEPVKSNPTFEIDPFADLRKSLGSSITDAFNRDISGGY